MNLSGFFPYVAPEVLGCPEPVIARMVLQAASDFCIRTQSWTELQDPIALVAGTRDYDVPVPVGAYLASIREVWVGTRQIHPVTLPSVGGFNSGTMGDPTGYNMSTGNGVISVFPTPEVITSDSVLYVRGAYAPTLTATTLPDYLLTKYQEEIVAGTLARLMAMPMASWSNPPAAKHYRGIFISGVQTARIFESKDRSPTTLRVTPQWF